MYLFATTYSVTDGRTETDGQTDRRHYHAIIITMILSICLTDRVKFNKNKN